MELRRYLSIFREHLLLILVALLVALAIGWTTASRTKIYKAQASLYVGPSSINTGSNSSTDVLTLAEQIITTYQSMIDSKPVAQDAVQIAGNVRSAAQAEAETSATAGSFSQLIVVSVVDTDPSIAAALANATVVAFQHKAASFTGVGGIPTFPVFPFESATPPTAPLSNGLNGRLVTSALFGLVIGAAGALILEYLDLTIRGSVDAGRKLELPVLGAIPLR